MNEVTFDADQKDGWVYAGRKKNGEAKFRKYTNQTVEHVKSYLDEKGITYMVDSRGWLMFIYKDKEPKSQYSPRYAYYLTTGRWGSDKRNKHYHSDGIEHFIETYYRTSEQDRLHWEQKRKEEEEANEISS